MRNPQAFEVADVLEIHRRSEVGFQQFPVSGPEGVHRQGFAGFGHGVGVPLEFSEHGLTVDGGDDIVNLLADDVGFHLVVRAFPDKLVGQKLLIEGGGHLRFEDGVVVLREGIAADAVPGVHGMAAFMGQGEHVPQHIFLEVHQDVGVADVGAGAEGA